MVAKYQTQPLGNTLFKEIMNRHKKIMQSAFDSEKPTAVVYLFGFKICVSNLSLQAVDRQL
jgi:hypothetical protein